MKYATLLLLFALTLSGCAALDALLLGRMRDAQGQDLFITADGRLTTESHDSEGRPHEPAFHAGPGEGAQALMQGAAALGGPWGGALGAGLGLLAAAYAALRGRRRVSAERAKTAAFSGGMALVVGLLEDLKSGALDADKNGRVSLAEIREYVRRRGKEAINPAFVAEVVRIVTGTFTETEKQRLLEEAAERLAGRPGPRGA